jgi:flagellar biosynthesis protein FlhA
METARRLVGALESQASSLTSQGLPVVVLAPPDLRRPLYDFSARFVPDVCVVAARELVPGTTVEPAGTLQALALAGAA